MDKASKVAAHGVRAIVTLAGVERLLLALSSDSKQAGCSDRYGELTACKAVLVLRERVLGAGFNLDDVLQSRHAHRRDRWLRVAAQLAARADGSVAQLPLVVLAPRDYCSFSPVPSSSSAYCERSFMATCNTLPGRSITMGEATLARGAFGCADWPSVLRPNRRRCRRP